MKKGSPCTGHCCESIFTCYSLSEWKRYKRACLRKQKTFSLDNGNRQPVGSNTDEIIYIADMLIPVKVDRRKTKLTDRGINPSTEYHCKHYNKETRLCTAYEKRPSMCRDYPEYGDPERKCNYHVPINA